MYFNRNLGAAPVVKADTIPLPSPFKTWPILPIKDYRKFKAKILPFFDYAHTPLPFTPTPKEPPKEFKPDPTPGAGNFFRESIQISRIIRQHRKLKDLKGKVRLVPRVLATHSELLKYLSWYLDLYRNKLESKTVSEMESVLSDAPSLGVSLSGLGLIPLIIFGLSVLTGGYITKTITDTVKENIDKQEKEIELNRFLVEQGKDPLKKEAGFFGEFTDIMKVGLLVGGGLLLLNVFKKKRTA